MDTSVSLPARFTAFTTPNEGLVKIADAVTSKEGLIPLACYPSVAGLLTELFSEEGEELVQQTGVSTGSVTIPEPEAPVEPAAQDQEAPETAEAVAESKPKGRAKKAAAPKAKAAPKKRGRMSKDDRAAATADLLAQDFVPADAEPESAVAAAPEPEEKSTPAPKAAAKAAPKKAPAKGKPATKAKSATKEEAKPAKAAAAKPAKAAAAKSEGDDLPEVIEDMGFKLVLRKGERAYDIKPDNGGTIGTVELAADSDRVRVVPVEEPASEHTNLKAAFARIDVLVQEDA